MGKLFQRTLLTGDINAVHLRIMSTIIIRILRAKQLLQCALLTAGDINAVHLCIILTITIRLVREFITTGNSRDTVPYFCPSAEGL